MSSIPENEANGDGNEGKNLNRRGNQHCQRRYKLNTQNKP